MALNAVARLRSSDSKTIEPWVPWIIGALPMLLFFLLDLKRSDGGLIADAVFWGRDFINVWTGGHLVRSGNYATLYDLQAYSAFQETLFGPLDRHNYSYPPVSYPIAAFMSLLPYWAALTLWIAGTGALFVRSVRAWWPEPRISHWLVLLTPAALVNVWTGHYGFLIGALFLFGWRNVEKQRPVLAGLCFALMLLKPHLAVLVPLVLALRREWRVIGWSAAFVVGLISLTSLLFGVQPWLDYVLRAGSVQTSLIDAGSNFFRVMSPSVMTAALFFGLTPLAALLLQIGVASLGVAMIVDAGRRQELRPLVLLSATGTFLILPYSFCYDMTVMMVAAITLMRRDSQSYLGKRIVVLGFLAPTVGMVLGMFGFQLMPLMVLGLAAVQYQAILTNGRAGPAGAAAVRSA